MYSWPLSVARLWAVAVVFCLAHISLASDYSESGDGDLSGDGLDPTSFSLGLGSNLLSGSTLFEDLDYLTVNVPAGQLLSQLVLNSYTGDDGVAFIAVQAGPQVTLPAPNPPSAAGLLGWTHFGSGVGNIGMDLLPSMSIPNKEGFGSDGFTPPLGPGVYSFWIQQTTSPNEVNYQFNFLVTQVPEPTSVSLGCLALIGAANFRRRGRER